MKMPFAELKGVTFTEAEMDRVVRDAGAAGLCTLRNTIHGGAIMAFADLGRAAASSTPADAKGTTTIESKTTLSAAPRRIDGDATATPVHRGRRTQVWQTGWRPRTASSSRS